MLIDHWWQDGSKKNTHSFPVVFLTIHWKGKQAFLLLRHQGKDTTLQVARTTLIPAPQTMDTLEWKKKTMNSFVSRFIRYTSKSSEISSLKAYKLLILQMTFTYKLSQNLVTKTRISFLLADSNPFPLNSTLGRLSCTPSLRKRLYRVLIKH